MLKDYLFLIPHTYLLAQLLFDFWYMKKYSKDRGRFYLGDLVVIGFFGFYMYFINSGINISNTLLLETYPQQIISTIITILLFVGYNVTKMLTLKLYKNLLGKEGHKSFYIFLRYFVFSSGSMLTLLMVTFFILAITH